MYQNTHTSLPRQGGGGVAVAHPSLPVSRFARAAALVALSLILALSGAYIPSREADAAQEGLLVVAIDPGHGGSDSGAVGVNGLREADVNWDIANACVNELNSYTGVKAVLTQGKDECLGRQERVNAALSQGAGVVISVHCNSADSASANGSEVFVPNEGGYLNDETHGVTYGLGKRILANLQALGLQNRGVKTLDSTNVKYPDGSVADYYGIIYYSRLAGIPGMIVEHAFVSNEDDAKLLSSASSRASMGVADAAAIAAYYGLSKASAGGGDVSAETVNSVGEQVDTLMAYDEDPTIMGTSRATVERMVSWFNESGREFPSSIYGSYGAGSIQDFCNILFQEAKAEGVRAEVVFAQAMKETGWFSFAGQVKPEQCNFCGLGAVDGGAAGVDFSSYGESAVRMGLRAQVQHLKAYATTEALKNACVDPRFNLVLRGSAGTVGTLAGQWATDGAYGDGLAVMINGMLGLTDPDASTDVQLSLVGAPASISGSSATVYVDGVPQQMAVSASGNRGTIELAGAGAHSVVYYEFNDASSENPHTVYPIHMYAWVVSDEGGCYHVRRYYGFDDLLRYAGSSIRVTSKKGIRMITGMASTTKGMLVASNSLGYTLVETGTLIAWSSNVGSGGLTFDTEGVSRGRAYVQGEQNPVFERSNGVEYYTNVLVGFSSADQYDRDLAMRPYAILEDSLGNQVTVYGGTVERSILYIAMQNADSFAPGTTAYDYIHGIIDAC